MLKLQLDQNTHSFLEHLFYNLDDDEYIRTISFDSKGTPYTKHHKSVDDLIEDHNKGNVYYNDRYFQIQSTNGINGTKSNRKYSYCLAFDVDLCDNSAYSKEQLHQMKLSNNDTYKEEMSDLLSRIFKATKDINFYIHYIVSSGFGFHIYQLIQKTDDFDKVEEVQQKIYDLLMERSIVVDKKALSPTQILRIPMSYNNKISRNKPKVTIITNNVNGNNKQSIDFRRLSINTLYDVFVKGKRPNSTNKIDIDQNSTAKGLIKRSDGKNKYLEYVMLNGSKEGVRHKDYVNIIVYLKYKKVGLDKIIDVIKEWSKLSNYESEISDKNIINYYNNQMYYIELSEEEKQQYYSISHSYSDFNYTDDEVLVDYDIKLYRKGKGVIMKGYSIFVYNLFYYSKETYLTMENLVELSTNNRTKEKSISLRTVDKAIKELLDLGLIKKVVGNKKLKVKDHYCINDDIDNSKRKIVKISVTVNEKLIDGLIDFEDLRFYTYLRIIQRMMVESGQCLGNELKFLKQKEMADQFGASESKIRRLINNLYESGLIKKYTKWIDINKSVCNYILVK